MKRRLSTCFFPIVLAVLAPAQSPDKKSEEKLSFETASIKPSATGRGRNGFGGGKRISIDPGTFRMRTADAEEMIQFAYNVYQPNQLVGLRDEIGHYDIDAKTPFPASEAQQRLMLQSLLEERFHFKCHQEQREMKGFALVASKDFKLEPVESDVSGSLKVTPGAAGAMTYVGQAVPMSALTAWLAGGLNAPVVDHTNLTGKFNVELHLTYQVDSSALSNGSGPAGGRMQNIEMDERSYISAIKKLGLNVEPARVSMPVLIVDHIEKPVTN